MRVKTIAAFSFCAASLSATASASPILIGLDFDGRTVLNWGPGGAYKPGKIPAAPFTSGMIDGIVAQENFYFSGYNVQFVVGDVPGGSLAGKRYQVVIGGNSGWTGLTTSGLTYYNDLTLGTTGISFVFPDMIGDDTFETGQIIAHEVGHSVNLRHHATWVNGVKINDYDAGDIMGNPLGFVNASWSVHITDLGNMQDDRKLLAAGLGTVAVSPEPSILGLAGIFMLSSRRRRKVFPCEDVVARSVKCSSPIARRR